MADALRCRVRIGRLGSSRHDVVPTSERRLDGLYRTTWELLGLWFVACYSGRMPHKDTVQLGNLNSEAQLFEKINCGTKGLESRLAQTSWSF